MMTPQVRWSCPVLGLNCPERDTRVYKPLVHTLTPLQYLFQLHLTMSSDYEFSDYEYEDDEESMDVEDGM